MSLPVSSTRSAQGVDSAPSSREESCVRNARGEWIPADSVKISPLLIWPPSPRRWLKWLLSYPGFLWPWNGLYLLITIFIWRFLQPSLARCQEFKADWIGLIFLRNLGLAWAVYGGWHLLLYIWKLQGTERKYDIRWPKRTDPKFLFKNQTYENMFWSCASGVSIWTAYEVIYFWLCANHRIPYLDWSRHPIYGAVWLCAIPFWRDFHFYWIHRFIHWQPLFNSVHVLHHKNTNPGPWSGLSMHPVEHVLYFSSVLIHFVVPSHPIHLLYNSELTGAFMPAAGHHGFDKPLLAKALPSGNYFHYVHHRVFNCHFGGQELPLDRWFGTYRRSLVAVSDSDPANPPPP
jgi:sterol desaturase/sphingolipid hydroxylase (fatty acid hydroxylase superfamily)